MMENAVFELGQVPGSDQSVTGQHRQAVVGIVIDDRVTRRLIENFCLQLEMSPVLLSSEEVATIDPSNLSMEVGSPVSSLMQCELIVAESGAAGQVRQLLNHHRDQSEGVNPTLVEVRYRSNTSPLPQAGVLTTKIPPLTFQPHTLGEEESEPCLILPQEPAQVLAQLSVLLYARRSFVRRYQSAMDELHLNRRIFRSVTSGISVADASQPDLPLVYVNPAFEVMTGYLLEEVQGKNCRFLQGEDRNQPSLVVLREAVAARREVVTVIRNYRKDGTGFWNELSLSPIRNRDGQVTHIVGIQMDVSARVEFEAALRESEKLAAVGRLAASIAHEINNPLEAVTNLLYLARHSTVVEEIKGYLDQADKELHRASLITTQSLRFYKQSTKPQAALPGEMLKAVLDLYEGKIYNAGISASFRERPTRPILCMESEVRQVLANLVRNSIDAMNGPRRRLLIRCREATEWRYGVPGVVVTIADTGSGIDPLVVKHLFTAFFTTKGIGGTGLGLWVSSEIIKRHKGRLVLRSSNKPGKSWTVFQLYLPHQGLDAPVVRSIA
jgi:two-component system sporulation sensor kinase C